MPVVSHPARRFVGAARTLAAAGRWPLAAFGLAALLFPAKEFVPAGTALAGWRWVSHTPGTPPRPVVEVVPPSRRGGEDRPRTLCLRLLGRPGAEEEVEREILPGLVLLRGRPWFGAKSGRDELVVAAPWAFGGLVAATVGAWLLGRRRRRLRSETEPPPVPARAMAAAGAVVWTLAAVGIVCLAGGRPGGHPEKPGWQFYSGIRRDPAVAWNPRTLWVSWGRWERFEVLAEPVDFEEYGRAVVAPRESGAVLFGSRRWGGQVDRAPSPRVVAVAGGPLPEFRWRRWEAAANLSWLLLPAAIWAAVRWRRAGSAAPGARGEPTE